MATASAGVLALPGLARLATCFRKEAQQRPATHTSRANSSAGPHFRAANSGSSARGARADIMITIMMLLGISSVRCRARNLLGAERPAGHDKSQTPAASQCESHVVFPLSISLSPRRLVSFRLAREARGREKRSRASSYCNSNRLVIREPQNGSVEASAIWASKNFSRLLSGSNLATKLAPKLQANVRRIIGLVCVLAN